MADLQSEIVAAIARKSYQPIKAKALARKLGVPASQYARFQTALRELIKQGRAELAKGQVVRQAKPHGTVVGMLRKTSTGAGYVRPHAVDGHVGPEVFIRENDMLDAATGDQVLVRVIRKPNRPDATATGEVLQVLERATRQFVGTYFDREGQGYVRVDGTVFSHSIYVGDPGAKGAKADDKVVFEMLRFPSAEDRGEGVITEILGPRGQPGVDTLSIIRSFGLPDVFPEEALEEARQAAVVFRDGEIGEREDFTKEPVITIDPPDAHDFDDAVQLTQDPKTKHWQLTVHIADVAHFVPVGGALDREARKRGNSVYLPQKVIPMFPEIISNGLASLQQGKLRYTKTVIMDFTPQGQRTDTWFTNGVIKVRKRFSYDQVSAILKEEERAGGDGEGPHGTPPVGVDDEVLKMLFRLRDFALILRKRRIKRGALELSMPEIELEYDDQGRVTGGHFAKHDISHQLVEECMLAANEAVAEHLDALEVAFLRRIHPPPEPTKLEAFADFANSLGYKIDSEVDRFALQKVLEKSLNQPEVHAVHYALLRSLKQAVYGPDEEGHYALASADYCHFTSPIRRYPDLTVHRLLEQWLRTGKAGSDAAELAALGDHCSKTERRADIAERDLIKVRLLDYMSQRIGLEMEGIITGVADYGFFTQAAELPVEGLVHISTLTDDYYHHDAPTHSLIGNRNHKRYRLGDRIAVQVVRVDLQRRQMDFRVLAKMVEKADKVEKDKPAKAAKKRR